MGLVGLTFSSLDADGHELPRGHGVWHIHTDVVVGGAPGRGRAGGITELVLRDRASIQQLRPLGGVSGSARERHHQQRVIILGEPLGSVFPSREAPIVGLCSVVVH